MSHTRTGFEQVVWLDGGTVDRALVGGKATSLSNLVALGAPVPPAFAIATSAFAGFSAFHGLPRRVSDLVPEQLDALRETIRTGSLPEGLASAVGAAFQRLAPAGDDRVSLAVRSSATAEDSAAFSFAGLHDTILDVRSRDGLDAAIRRCWASLWSDRAIAYRRDQGLAHEESDIAVVVQRLVRSDISFVAFSVDPVSGDVDTVVIDAAWGLGEAIVSGLVTPDHIAVGRDGTIRDFAVNRKQVMVIPGERPGDGTREVPVPRMLQESPALSPGQAREIAAMVRDLADRFGYPADVEGGFASGAMYLFQARPITTLQREAGPV